MAISRFLYETIGPFTRLIPFMNVGLAFLLMVWSLESHPGFGLAAVCLLLVDVVASTQQKLFAAPTTWEGTTWMGFGAFVGLFGLPIVAIHYQITVAKDAKMRRLWFETMEPWQIIATQILRLGGGVFFLLAFDEKVPWIYGVHTGVLDVFMGLTAPPIAAWIKSKGVQSNATLLYVWHAIGLYDFLWALGYIFLEFCGLVGTNFGPVTAPMGFYPISLLAFYQVAWAFTLHVFFLVNMQTLVEVEQQKKAKRAS